MNGRVGQWKMDETLNTVLCWKIRAPSMRSPEFRGIFVYISSIFWSRMCWEFPCGGREQE